MKKFSKTKIINYLKSEIKKNNGEAPSHDQLKFRRKTGAPGMTTIQSYFGTYEKALRESGYKGELHGRYNIDEDFFKKINNEAKAYFFGLIITDGGISKSRNSLSILLIEPDKHILEELCKRLKSSSYLSFIDIKKKHPKRNNIYRFDRTGKKLLDNLRKIGIAPQKTFSTKYPNESILPKNLNRHFLRGVFDGDGAINKDGRVDIASASKPFLDGIKNILTKELDISDYCIVEKRKKNNFRLRINRGKKNYISKKIFNYFYKKSDPKLRLKRKYSSFLQRRVSLSV